MPWNVHNSMLSAQYIHLATKVTPTEELLRFQENLVADNGEKCRSWTVPDLAKIRVYCKGVIGMTEEEVNDMLTVM